MAASNMEIRDLAKINNISCEVRRRRWNWIGSILRREGEDDLVTALGWHNGSRM